MPHPSFADLSNSSDMTASDVQDTINGVCELVFVGFVTNNATLDRL